jgi:DNA-binding MarR family transcriptional regulator
MTRISKIPHDETIGRTLMLLTQTARLISKYADAYFYKKTDVSFTKFMALKILDSAGKNEVMTPTRLAEWTQTELHSVTMLVDRMKKDGLVYTERSEIDRRNVFIFLTDKGRNVLEQAKPLANVLIEHVMSSVTEADAAQLEKILVVLRDNAYDRLESIERNP